jgi:predicted nucleotidyltransferase
MTTDEVLVLFVCVALSAALTALYMLFLEAQVRRALRRKLPQKAVPVAQQNDVELAIVSESQPQPASLESQQASRSSRVDGASHPRAPAEPISLPSEGAVASDAEKECTVS